MDHIKSIAKLAAENELLQLELEDLLSILKKREEEISLLGDSVESAASLQSRIDNNQAEIDQLHYNNKIESQKTTAAETQSEELELSLLKETKARQIAQTAGLKIESLRAELDIVSGELEDSVPVYEKLQQSAAELAEANSRASLLETENTCLKTEIAELKALVKELRQKRM